MISTCCAAGVVAENSRSHLNKGKKVKPETGWNPTARLLRGSGKVLADAVEQEGFYLRGRYPRDAARFCLPALPKRGRDVVTVAHAELVRMGRAHAVAAVVEDAAGENGARAFKPNLAGDRVSGKLGLHRLE